MSRYSLLACASFSALPLLLAACSSASGDGGSPAPHDEDAGTSVPPSPSSAPEAAAPDATPSAPAFVSNTPGATVVDVGSPPTPGLVLVSLNFLQQPSGGQYYQQWLGEMENVGATPICDVSLNIVYEDASGNAIASPPTTYADADPYALSGFNESVPCIAPGKIGSFYTNGFADSMTALGSVATIAVKFGSLTEPGVAPDPNAPDVTSQPQSTNLGYEVNGTIAVATNGGPINDVRLDVYPRDATGLVLAQLSAVDLGAITQGSPFPFTTDAITPAFTEYRQFVQYIQGAAAGDPIRRGISVARLSAQADVDARAALARSRE